jgi:GAF domain-containing protein
VIPKAPPGLIDPDALERSLAGLRERPPSGTLLDSLGHVIAATRQLFDATGAGVMMIDDSSALSVLAATDEPGRLLEVRQQEAGHGPCVDSLTLDRSVMTPDLAADERWPMLRKELADAGVRAVLGVPVHVATIPVGSLNVYRDLPGEWSEGEVTALEAYVPIIEGLLQAALQAREGEQLADQLQHALANRVVIDRAVGVIMGRDRVGAVDAFNKLRKTARSSGRKVADVAGELLAEISGTSSG